MQPNAYPSYLVVIPPTPPPVTASQIRRSRWWRVVRVFAFVVAGTALLVMLVSSMMLMSDPGPTDSAADWQSFVEMKQTSSKVALYASLIATAALVLAFLRPRRFESVPAGIKAGTRYGFNTPPYWIPASPGWTTSVPVELQSCQPPIRGWRFWVPEPQEQLRGSLPHPGQ